MKQEPEPTEIITNDYGASNDSGHLGHVTIVPAVLLSIVRQTVLSQPGVVRLSSRNIARRAGNSKMRSASAKGLRIEIGQDHSVGVDVYLVVSGQTNMRELAETLQSEITRALQMMVDMTAREVNVHIDAVDLGSSGAQETATEPRTHRR